MIPRLVREDVAEVMGHQILAVRGVGAQAILAEIKFLEDHDDWKGEHSYGEEGGKATLAPDSWPEDENGGYWAWYTLGPSKASNEDYQYDLTALFAQGPTRSFRLELWSSTGRGCAE